MPAKNGWFNASLAEMRFLGSKASNCSSKSTPELPIREAYLLRPIAGQTGNAGFQSCNLVTPGQTLSLGVPKILRD